MRCTPGSCCRTTMLHCRHTQGPSRAVPKDLFEAAFVDGCGYIRFFLAVTLPLSRPILAAVGIFTFVKSWNDYLLPLILLDSEAKYRWPLGIMVYQGEYSTDWQLVLGLRDADDPAGGDCALCRAKAHCGGVDGWSRQGLRGARVTRNTGGAFASVLETSWSLAAAAGVAFERLMPPPESDWNDVLVWRAARGL
jgi:hypothetical protein